MPPPVRLLHLFDRYLNSTMNWAYRLIRHTPGTEAHISAGILINNQYYDENFQYICPPYQHQLPVDEWHIPAKLRYRQLADRYIFHQYPRLLINEIKKRNIQVLHAHFAHTGCFALPVAQTTGVPLCVSFYGLDYESLPYRKPRYVRLYRQLFREATAFICEGPHGATHLEAMGCPPEKIHIIPLGIIPEQITVSDRTKVPEQLRLLQAATFTEKKGHMDCLKAFSEALHTCPNMHLTLLGEVADKKLFAKVLDFIDQKRLKDHVQILDFIPFDRFYDFLQHFDVFIHPSCYAANRDCEGGAPVVLLDVQATGMPVISTTHCDIPFEVIHQKTGLLGKEHSIPELINNIKYFYNINNTDYQIFRKQAAAYIRQQFDISRSGEALSQLYRKSI